MKIVLNIVGSLAVILALLGVFLPLLPTTPFLLLASACFVRSSDRMHRWLLNNRVFGEYLRNFESGRGIPLRAKLVAIALLWLSMGWSIWLVKPVLLKLMLAAIGISVTIYLARFKTLREPVAGSDADEMKR